MLLWKVSGLVLPQWGQNWNFCFLFSCGVFFNFHHREQSETYAANVISLFLNSKVLILWEFKNLVTLKKKSAFKSNNSSFIIRQNMLFIDKEK